MSRWIKRLGRSPRHSSPSHCWRIAGRRAVGQTAAVELRANLPPPGPAGLNEVSGADLRDVLGELPEGVAVLDGSGRLLYANAEAVRIWGFDDPGEVPPSFRGFAPAFELRDADGAAVPVERWPATRALAGERLDGLEFQLVRRDGSIRWVRCAGGPVELEVGGGNGAWISFRDVGREEAILRELREERDLVTALVDMSPLAVAVVRAPELVVELANDVAKALRPEVDMVGTPVAQVFPEAGRPASSTSCSRSPRPARRCRSRTRPWSGGSRTGPAPSP